MLMKQKQVNSKKIMYKKNCRTNTQNMKPENIKKKLIHFTQDNHN